MFIEIKYGEKFLGVQSSVHCLGPKMLQVCQNCPSISILICQNKRVHHTVYSKKGFYRGQTHG